MWTQKMYVQCYHRMTGTPTIGTGIFGTQMSQMQNRQRGEERDNRPVIGSRPLVQTKVKTEQREKNQLAQLDPGTEITETVVRDYSAAELRELLARMRQQPGEPLATWLTQLWEQGAGQVHLKDTEIRCMSTLSTNPRGGSNACRYSDGLSLVLDHPGQVKIAYPIGIRTPALAHSSRCCFLTARHGF